ncbi:MAG: ATPase domain-containing protein [Candidatus Micrarchaeota archaeon]
MPKLNNPQKQPSTDSTRKASQTNPKLEIKASEKFAEISKKLHEDLSFVVSESNLDIERVPTGIKGFDNIIQGGFVRGSTIMLSGGAGTGKTIFALQYLYNGITRYNENGVYISFNETKEAVYRHAQLFGYDLKKLEAENKFAFIKYEPHEVDAIISEGGGSIKDTIDNINAKRIAIDSLTTYTLLFENAYKESEAILDLFNILKRWGMTALVIAEVGEIELQRTQDRSIFLSDGVIFTYYLRKELSRSRAIEVIKMRDTSHKEKICPFTITNKGIVVFPEAQVFGFVK